MATKQKLSKRTDRAFGKKVYLLGIDNDGQYVWLEEARWDCDWYWGFGYIERYNIGRGKNPHLSSDIRSHSHYDGLLGKHEHYDVDTGKWVLDSTYVHHINESPEFTKTVLTDSESWKLSELMGAFYTLKKTAELYHTHNPDTPRDPPYDQLKNNDRWKEINEKLLPSIFKEIDILLSPEGAI